MAVVEPRIWGCGGGDPPPPPPKHPPRHAHTPKSGHLHGKSKRLILDFNPVDVDEAFDHIEVILLKVRIWMIIYI
jgi:hypothetical protein